MREGWERTRAWGLVEVEGDNAEKGWRPIRADKAVASAESNSPRDWVDDGQVESHREEEGWAVVIEAWVEQRL